MAALHSIRLDLEPESDRTLQFKSPDFQRIMTQFRESVGEVSDAEKFRLFLELEKVPYDEMAELTGITTSNNSNNRTTAPGSQTAANGQVRGGKPKKNFIPYLKEKLIWS